MKKLSQEQRKIFFEIIEKYQLPYLLMENMSEKLKKYLIDVLSHEFCATGLQENSEPNHRGLLESILEIINSMRLFPCPCPETLRNE
jgi:hypothetical protein